MPRVSVILAAYYSDTTLRDCLRSLRQQTYRDFEAILVNSSAEERTAAVVQEFPEVVFLQSPARLLPHAARNLGVKHATGGLLVFSDADCYAHPDWLQYLVQAWESGRAAIGGAMALANQRWFPQGVHLCKFHRLLEGQPAGTQWILPTANAAYSREAWERSGPFEGEVFAGDAVLSWRVRDAGFEPRFEPRAVVAHTHGGTAAGFVRERWDRGAEFGAVRAAYERWSRGRLIVKLVATPLTILGVLMRAAADCSHSGRLRSYLWTFPLQIVGHGGWTAGEARGYWGLLTKSRNRFAPLPQAQGLTPDSR
jgi:GT2 family glycosyltransferase